MRQLVPVLAVFSYFGLTLTYKAAVVEYTNLRARTPKEKISKNLEAYRRYAEEAKAQNVDIVVFPENGLTSADPELNLRKHATKVSKNNHVVEKLAAIASQNQVYLVVNLLEKVREKNKTIRYHNTNLVFDRRGDIILKYRKINLFQEPGLTPGDVNQTVTFTTDFGVNFGIFTCFDMLWENPSSRVLEDSNVTDIVFPTAWSALMPFLTPLSVQHGYSLANGVNLLAAGYNKPRYGLGGSGIYLADGKIAENYLRGRRRSKLLVQEVPKISERRNKTKCEPENESRSSVRRKGCKLKNLFIYPDLIDKSRCSYQNIDLSQPSALYEICHNEFCCTFDISIEQNRQPFSGFYKLIAYDGWFEFFDFKGHVRLCSLLLCKNDFYQDCGRRYNTSVKFQKIRVKGRTLLKNKTTVFRPVTLDYCLHPIQDSVYCEPKDPSGIEIMTTAPQQDVLVFGLVGKTVSAASSTHRVIVFLLIVLEIVKYILVQYSFFIFSS